jgi:two-component system, sporulation sensor kinase D
MSDAHYLTIIDDHREAVISHWYKSITEVYSGFYNNERLLQETHSYFDFLLQLDIPLESHKLIETIPQMCEHFHKRDIDITQIIQSNQLWVDTILFFVQEDGFGEKIPMSLIRKIIQRVYDYEKKFLAHYYRFTRDVLESHQRKITDLHEARLNIVGKMAASMAHEIRNPLTTVLGFLKLIRNQALNNSWDKMLNYVAMIESEFQNIQMQITGFLSFSKKEIIEEAFVFISSHSLIQSVIDMITPRLINDNISFVFRDGDDVQLHVQKIAVQQVLSNILNNSIDALSELERGRELNVSSRFTGDEFIISVFNNGPEIPMDIRGSLFEPFVTSKKEGTGLGLAICKQIMAKNFGDVTFTSSARETFFYIQFLKVGHRAI